MHEGVRRVARNLSTLQFRAYCWREVATVNKRTGCYRVSLLKGAFKYRVPLRDPLTVPFLGGSWVVISRVISYKPLNPKPTEPVREP